MRIIVLPICLVLFISCASIKKEVITKSTIKLEGKNTNIRNLIEIDGYYCMSEDPDSNCRIFYDDGTWAAFSFKWDIPENEKKVNISGSLVNQVEDKQLQWNADWGVYKIVNDTIVVHQYTKRTFWVGWSLNEEKYKIINKETILRLNFRGLLKNASYYEANDYLNEEYHYISADFLPSSDCWLKEEKWIWRNESDWKTYMDRIKQMKAQK